MNNVAFRWREEVAEERNFDTEVHYGLIAQEVAKVFPEMVTTDEKGYKAVKELQAQIEALRKELQVLKTR